MIYQSTKFLAVITDFSINSPHSFIDQITMAIDGGVNMVHLREKNLPTSELYDLAMKIREITKNRALFFINDRVDLAISCQADGVQIGSTGLPINVVRMLVGSDVWIGKSVHSTEEAVTAESEGADLILLGTIFPSNSHPDFAGVGVGEIQRTCSVIDLPVIAIGGINQYNISDVVNSGASGAAVITAIMASSDPYSESIKLSGLINNKTLSFEEVIEDDY